jgi:putative ABC transport system permease protein
MTGPINWFTQVFSIAIFNLRSLPERKGAAIATAVGIAGVVGVLVGVLAIAEGFRRVMIVSGTPDVAVVLRSGADSEMTSGLSREEVRTISDAPGVARSGAGPLASAEMFVIIDLPKRSTGTGANVPLRGVDMTAFDVRGTIQMAKGRRFESGKNEIVVGAGAAREFGGLDLGRELRVGQNTWTVVGIFTANGGVAESEIWADGAVLRSAYKREENYQSVYVRLNSGADYQPFKDALTTNPQLKVKVALLADFYAEQSTAVTEFITTIGVFIAAMMALGALFGALNTMYSAVSSRTREIATLRALGFGSSPIILSVLFESIVLALAGGAVGGAIAYFVFNGFTATTMNFQTFSQVTFAFAVTPELLVRAMIWATALGVLGGVFPAVRAARLPIAAALRET